jgi:uncharacterized protein YceK
MLAALGIAAGLLMVTGCGTVSGLSEDAKSSGYTGVVAKPSRVIYAGVRYDLRMLSERSQVPVEDVLKVMVIVDLPFSACADTLCLPYTIYRRLTESQRTWWVEDVVFTAQGWRLLSSKEEGGRNGLSLPELCAELQHITGPPHSVRVNVSAEMPLPLADYGKLYETIQANPALKLAYQSAKINHLQQQYRMEKTAK